MRFYITQKDIEEGEPHSTFWCPVALCMRRTLNKMVRVTGSQAIVGSIVEPEIYQVPDQLYNFIRMFDAGEKMNPFEFELDIKNENESKRLDN